MEMPQRLMLPVGTGYPNNCGQALSAHPQRAITMASMAVLNAGRKLPGFMTDPGPGVPMTFATSKMMPTPAAKAAQARKIMQEEMRNDSAVESAAKAEEEQTESEVHTRYTPQALHDPDAREHPDPIVETQSLASVAPPEITYRHHLQDIVRSGKLSNLQLESVLYAMQKFEGPLLPSQERQGFFLGDGAGVGKGRQIAALIKEHWKCGRRRALWVSVSSDLRRDAQRDLEDLDAGDIPLYPRGTAALPAGRLPYECGVVFATYSLLVRQMGGEYATRLEQLVDWLNGEAGGDPLVAFDECHKAKNLALLVTEKRPGYGGAKGRVAGSKDSATKTARAVVQLQTEIPGARVLYCSATGASVPQNLGYMCRLGNFGFRDLKEMIQTIQAGGMGAMEMTALGLKSMGSYLCRTLSYHGAEFEVKEVPIDKELRIMMDRAAQVWQLLYRLFREVQSHGGNVTGRTWSQFWAAHQRFARQMLLSAKVPEVARMSKQAVYQNNMAVIIGLQSTGEAATSEAMAAETDDLPDDFVSTPELIIRNLIEKQFPTQSIAGCDRASFRTLHRKVRECVQEWCNLPTVTEKARRDEEAERAQNNSAEDDDDIVIMKEQTFEETLKIQREEAKLTGRYIILEEDEVGDAASGASSLAASDMSLTDAQRRQRMIEANARLAQQHERISRESRMSSTVGPMGTVSAGLLAPVPDAALRTAVPPTQSKPEESRATSSDYKGNQDVPVDDGDISAAIDDGLDGRPVGSDDAPASPTGSTSDDDRDPMSAENDQGLSTEGLDMCMGGDDADGADLLLESIDSLFPSGPDAARTNIISPEMSIKSETSAPRDAAKIPAVAYSEDSIVISSGEDNESSDCEEVLPPQTKFAKTETHNASRSNRKPIRARGAAATSWTMPAGRGAPGDDSVPLEDNSILADIKALFLKAVDALELPPNPLDHLIFLLDGPNHVAEMTGRSKQLVRQEGGGVVLESRSRGGPAKLKNITQHDEFMAGTKLIAIISEAASSGISLQADRRVGNTRRRLHITLELPWSADRAIQQFGRSHRSNQVSAPVYCLLVTDAGGERRFASSAAKRLMALGALLRGDRRSLGAGQELKEFDIDNQYGRQALDRFLSDIQSGGETRMANVPKPRENWYGEAGRHLESVGIGDLEKRARGPERWTIPLTKRPNVSRFLNRILGLRHKEQKSLFDYFSATYDAVISEHKKNGTWACGMVDLVSESIQMVSTEPIHVDQVTGAITHLVCIRLNRGASWDKARSLFEGQLAEPPVGWDSPSKDGLGFWISQSRESHVGANRPGILLGLSKTHKARTQRMVRILQPNRAQREPMTLQHLKANYRRVSADEDEAKTLWEHWYNYYQQGCVHGMDCVRRKQTGRCDIGSSLQEQKLISGAVLPVWKRITAIMSRTRISTYKDDQDETRQKVDPVKAARAVLDNGTRVVGLALTNEEVDLLKHELNADEQQQQLIPTAGLLHNGAEHGHG